MHTRIHADKQIDKEVDSEWVIKTMKKEGKERDNVKESE